MALFLLSFVVIGLAVAGMAIGVIFGRRPIAGSCGGLNALDGGDGCSACANPCASHAARHRRTATRPEASETRVSPPLGRSPASRRARDPRGRLNRCS